MATKNKTSAEGVTEVEIRQVDAMEEPPVREGTEPQSEPLNQTSRDIPVDESLAVAGFDVTEDPAEGNMGEIDLDSFEGDSADPEDEDHIPLNEDLMNESEESGDDLKVEGETLEDIEANASAPSLRPTKKAKAKEQAYVSSTVARDKERVRRRTIQTDNQVAANWAQVKGAQSHQATIRSAQIVGAEEITISMSDGSTKKEPVALVKVFGFIGYIPLNELWVHMPHQLELLKDSASTEFLYRAKAYINNMAGGNVPIVIIEARYNPDSDRPFGIVASRRRALLTDIAAFYQPPDDRSHRTAAPVSVGDEVTATVISASGTRVQLNVRGLDVIVRANYLTSRYVESLNDMYHPGDRVIVRIDSIEWPDDARHNVHYLTEHEALAEALSQYKEGSRNYEAIRKSLSRDRLHRLPKIMINGRDGETAALFAKNGRHVRKNGRYRAIITDIYYDKKNNAPRVWLHLPDIDLIAQASQINYGGMLSAPKQGDYVEFNVMGATNKGVLYGGISRRL